MKTVSSGFVVRNKKGQILLGEVANHPPPYQWTVFKGQQEENESLIDAAMRELKEEAGIDIVADHKLNKYISMDYIYTYSLRQKDVYLFLLDDEENVLENFEFKCNSYFGDGETPEITGYMWVDIEKLTDYIFPSQRGLAEFLQKRYKTRWIDKIKE